MTGRRRRLVRPAQPAGEDALFAALRLVAADLHYGSFVVTVTVHDGQLRECEISDVKRKFRG